MRKNRKKEDTDKKGRKRRKKNNRKSILAWLFIPLMFLLKPLTSRLNSGCLIIS